MNFFVEIVGTDRCLLFKRLKCLCVVCDLGINKIEIEDVNGSF